MKPELKPCPFCKSKNVGAHKIASWAVVCEDCMAEGPLTQSRDKAIEAWNRNADPHRIEFPTYLRKMWAGGEVQAWLDEHTGHVAQKPTAKGSYQRYQEWKAKQGAEPLHAAESHLRDATKKHATQACNLQPSEPAPSDEEILRAMADAMGRLVPVSEFRWWDGWPGTRSFAQAALKAYRNLMATGQHTEES